MRAHGKEVFSVIFKLFRVQTIRILALFPSRGSVVPFNGGYANELYRHFWYDRKSVDCAPKSADFKSFVFSLSKLPT